MTLKNLFLLICALCLFACQKDDKTTAENPFFGFFDTNSIAIDTVEQAGDTWEYGFTFRPLQSGNITELATKLPATGTFVVTLWEISGANAVALTTQSIGTTNNHEAAFFNIADVAVSPQKQYGITILADAFYRITQSGNAPFVYPKTVGNIQIESFVGSVNNSTEASLPTTTNDTRVAPCVDVIFIAD